MSTTARSSGSQISLLSGNSLLPVLCQSWCHGALAEQRVKVAYIKAGVCLRKSAFVSGVASGGRTLSVIIGRIQLCVCCGVGPIPTVALLVEVIALQAVERQQEPSKKGRPRPHLMVANDDPLEPFDASRADDAGNDEAQRRTVRLGEGLVVHLVREQGRAFGVPARRRPVSEPEWGPRDGQERTRPCRAGARPRRFCRPRTPGLTRSGCATSPPILWPASHQA